MNSDTAPAPSRTGDIAGTARVRIASRAEYSEPYLVYTANAFALMGLRQLFFLIGGLLDRLVYLSKGLAFILAFIGAKLILEALHHQGVSWAPEIPILVSLGVILGTLAVTTVAGLATSRRDGAAAVPVVPATVPEPEESDASAR